LTGDPIGCAEGRQLSRRGVLRLFGTAGGLGLAGAAGSTLGHPASAWAAPSPSPAAPAAGTDTLVVLSLRGGMDGLSLVPPIGDPGYAKARPTLAVPAGAARRVDATFGLHPALAPLYPLWDAGKVAAVHAVGQPAGSRSHLTATQTLERASTTAGATGWIDRAVARIAGAGTYAATQVGDPALPVSVQGSHHPFAVGRLDDVRVEVSDNIVPAAGWQTALTALYQGAAPLVGGTLAAALPAAAQLQTLPPAPTAAELGYPPTDLGQALHDVARVIGAQLGVRVATVEVGGWDLHADLGSPTKGRMVDRVSELSLALAAFGKELGAGLDHVTVVTLTEFGRRVAENGSGGVDHGQGSAMLLLGGSVEGGKVHGRWPGLAPDKLVDGDLAVTTDYRQVLAEVLTRRCGIDAITTVFPGLTATPLNVVH
jgi:uncharacterized protein (DUF1501 family)